MSIEWPRNRLNQQECMCDDIERNRRKTFSTTLMCTRISIVHEKTFIGRISRGFDFLGYAISRNGLKPVSEDLSTRTLSLPIHPYLDEAAVERICDAVIGALS